MLLFASIVHLPVNFHPWSLDNHAFYNKKTVFILTTFIGQGNTVQQRNISVGHLIGTADICGSLSELEHQQRAEVWLELQRWFPSIFLNEVSTGTSLFQWSPIQSVQKICSHGPASVLASFTEQSQRLLIRDFCRQITRILLSQMRWDCSKSQSKKKWLSNKWQSRPLGRAEESWWQPLWNPGPTHHGALDTSENGSRSSLVLLPGDLLQKVAFLWLS